MFRHFRENANKAVLHCFITFNRKGQLLKSNLRQRCCVDSTAFSRGSFPCKHNSVVDPAVLPERGRGYCVSLWICQILPSKTRISSITKTKPSPPLGAYPQLRLCDQVGRAPSNIRTSTTSRIVPNIIYLSFFLGLGNAGLLLPRFRT